jgi:hypothetical protein
VTIRAIVCVFLLSALAAAPGRAATGTCSTDGTGDPCPIQFTPGPDGVDTGVYDFFGNGHLVVKFETVLTTFTLSVSANSVNNPLPLDPKEFPSGTTCVHYPGGCIQYDFTGTASGPNFVPVKNKDYKGLITLTLSYFTDQPVQRPAFGHAPGEITTFTEDILTSYSEQPISEGDPTMGGKTAGLSSVVALNQLLTETDTVCNLTITPTNVPSDLKPQVEVSFRLYGGSTSCPGTGAPLRDKTATLSLSTTDSDGSIVFPPVSNVEGNKFHWDNKNGLNEYDISLDGLAPATGLQHYAVTIFSSKFSPRIALFCVDPDSVVHQTESGCH